MINYTLNVYVEEGYVNSFKISAPVEFPLVEGSTVKLRDNYYHVFEADLLHGQLKSYETKTIKVNERLNESDEKRNIKENLERALKEMQQIRNGELPKNSWRELYDKLKNKQNK